MIPGFHGLDLIVILIVALLIFGPKRLPEMGASIGKSISAFKKGMSEVTGGDKDKEVKDPEVKEPEAKEAPAVIAQEQHYEGGYYPQENVTVERQTTTTTTAQPNKFE